MSTSSVEPVAPEVDQSASSRFESLYRAHVGGVGAFFARRSTDPQTVADLTSETFVRAISSIHTFEGRGSVRAWLIAIARAVYAQHQAGLADGRQVVDRLSRQVVLQDDELEDLIERIDAQRAGRQLLERAASLPSLERSAIELVDIAGMAPRDAARALGVPAGALRVRLFRARSRLRKEGDTR
jgi:RNA polymerase sigma-70 factor (ECF subfamily)